MITVEKVKEDVSRYRIENGIVIDKSNNTQVTDEETILNVKTSYLFYKEAYDAYQGDMKQFGKTTIDQNQYIGKTLEKFGANGEVNNWGYNKVINAILNNNGHYEEYISGKDLQNGKFSLLIEPKKQYTMAYLKLKLREKGLDIEDIKVSQDLSELQHNGVSKVIVDYKLKEYKKSVQNNDSEKQWDSMSIDERTRFIEAKMNEAKASNDIDSYNYWNANLNNISKVSEQVSEPIEQDPPVQEITEQKESNDKDYNYYFDEIKKSLQKEGLGNLTEEQQKQIVGEIFYNEGYLVESLKSDEDIKQIMNRAVNELGSTDLQNKIQNVILTDIQEKYQKQHLETKQTEQPKQNEDLDLSVLIKQLRSELMKIETSYHSMMSDGYIDDIELASLIRMNDKVINDGYSLRSMATDPKDIELINTVLKDLEQQKNQMSTMQNGVESASKII